MSFLTNTIIVNQIDMDDFSDIVLKTHFTNDVESFSPPFMVQNKLTDKISTLVETKTKSVESEQQTFTPPPNRKIPRKSQILELRDYLGKLQHKNLKTLQNFLDLKLGTDSKTKNGLLGYLWSFLNGVLDGSKFLTDDKISRLVDWLSVFKTEVASYNQQKLLTKNINKKTKKILCNNLSSKLNQELDASCDITGKCLKVKLISVDAKQAGVQLLHNFQEKYKVKSSMINFEYRRTFPNTNQRDGAFRLPQECLLGSELQGCYFKLSP